MQRFFLGEILAELIFVRFHKVLLCFDKNDNPVVFKSNIKFEMLRHISKRLNQFFS